MPSYRDKERALTIADWISQNHTRLTPGGEALSYPHGSISIKLTRGRKPELIIVTLRVLRDFGQQIIDTLEDEHDLTVTRLEFSR